MIFQRNKRCWDRLLRESNHIGRKRKVPPKEKESATDIATDSTSLLARITELLLILIVVVVTQSREQHFLEKSSVIFCPLGNLKMLPIFFVGSVSMKSTSPIITGIIIYHNFQSIIR